jgi:hypothetical protein
MIWHAVPVPYWSFKNLDNLTFHKIKLKALYMTALLYLWSEIYREGSKWLFLYFFASFERDGNMPKDMKVDFSNGILRPCINIIYGCFHKIEIFFLSCKEIKLNLNVSNMVKDFRTLTNFLIFKQVFVKT